MWLSFCLYSSLLGLQPCDKVAVLMINSEQGNFSQRFYMKMEFSSQGREMFLFFITNMVAVTSHAKLAIWLL